MLAVQNRFQLFVPAIHRVCQLLTVPRYPASQSSFWPSSIQNSSAQFRRAASAPSLVHSEKLGHDSFLFDSLGIPVETANTLEREFATNTTMG